LPENGDVPVDDNFTPWLLQQRISIMHMVPSLARLALAGPQKDLFLPDLRLLFFMGEPLTDELVHRWRARLARHAGIVNLYGPTETTLVKCFYCVPEGVKPGVQPAGSPLPHTQALIFNDDNRLCGINEIGEIVLRTPFRTLGYFNNPDENDSKFVKNPFRDDHNDLLYRTGDLGRYVADGTVEILGRIDDQVKIRGVRAEPAEIAAVLGRHSAVQCCHVLARKTEDGEFSLAAYVVAVNNKTASSAELRHYLAQHLPAALLPASFVFIDTLPLTSNGKLDRKALPDADNRGAGATTYMAPRNTLEESIFAIWADVLRKSRIGVYDNFFDVGGHSLTATQVISRLRAKLDAKIRLRHIFEYPTIAQLARLIGADHGATTYHSDQLLGEIEKMTEEDAQKLLAAK
jgi:acyl-CoA synthetase (AMP-forming)/AMP-acid ligase II/acyl carrier protein